MEWLKDENWNKKHSEKEIYLMVDHKWAFVVWEIAKIRKVINDKALLIHVDSHLDDVPELVQDERYFVAESEQDFIELIKFRRNEEDDNVSYYSKYELVMDNFLMPAFLRHTIQDIIYVCDQNREELTVDDFYNAYIGAYTRSSNKSCDPNVNTLKECYSKIQNQNKSIRRYFNVEEYLATVDSLPTNQSKILDLDLDYFYDSEPEPNLKSEEIIRKNLKQLKEHCEWDLITVALSPLFCGGDEECLYILDLFLEVFELEPSEFMDWR